MKKLLYIILLLPLWATAQNVSMNKTGGQLRTMLSGTARDTVPMVTGALVDGYILKYHAATNKWYASPDVASTLGTSAISLGGTANGLSYSSGNYRLHKVTATTGGVFTTGTDTIAGDKILNGDFTIQQVTDTAIVDIQGNLTALRAVSRYSVNSATKWDVGLRQGGNFKIYNHSTNSSPFEIDRASNLIIYKDLSAGIAGTDSIVVHNDTDNSIRRISPNYYLTPTGSGSGLSGVVLTTTNQSVAGNKTFTDALTIQHNLGLNPASNPAIFFQAASSTKWIMQASGDASANWQLARYNDAGVFQDYSISVNRSTGTTTLSGTLTGTSATFSGTLVQQNITDGINLFGQNTQEGTRRANLFSTSVYTAFQTVGATTLQLGTNGITRYTIDASGNNTWTGSGYFAGDLSVGTATPYTLTNYKFLTVSATTGSGMSMQKAGVAKGTIYTANDDLYIDAVGGQVFQTGGVTGAGTERGRFTSGGFFKASNDGTYAGSSGLYHELRTNQSGVSAYITNTNASSPYGVFIGLTGTTPNNSSNYFIRGEDASALRFMVTSDGGVHNFSANNVNLSDKRAKKSIVKAGSYWNIIKSIEFDNYKYKDQTDNRTLLGVMAQQVESIYPEWVSNSGSFGKASDGTNLKSVYEQQLQYGVNIVVQESMKRIEALEAEVKILKSK